MTRELARRFNHLYGQDPQFAARAKAALARLDGSARERYADLRRRFQEGGDHAALAEARVLVRSSVAIDAGQQALLLANLEGEYHQLLPAPEVLLTPTPKVPGLDGRKMSKSYGNTIGLTEEPQSIARKIKAMQTDPARVRRTDPGTPEKCPVWDLHKLYSSDETRAWVRQGCTTAGIGCIECKMPVIDRISEESSRMRERAQPYVQHPERVREILADGAARADAVAAETMQVVRKAMHLATESGAP
jgi:tryptophanyl-tRNA synthetase